MNPIHRRRNTCRLCGSNRLGNALPIRPSAIADAFVTAEQLADPQPAYPLDVYLCGDCGHAQLLDVLDPSVLFANYIYETSICLKLKEHFEAYAVAMRGLQPGDNPGQALDMGRNDGTLLAFMKGHGFRVLGIDPAREIAARATARGIETLPTFFTAEMARELRKERGEFSIITANNVFAHNDALSDMADGIRILLTRDGVFAFEVSYLADMVHNMVFDWIYHEHLCYHSIIPLRRFFSAHDLELIDVQRVGTKGGSIRYLVQQAGGPRSVSPVEEQMCQEERATQLHTLAHFQAFYQKIETEKAHLVERLNKARSQGLTIAGYGASATTTTLIYHFEIGPFLDFIVDDDRLRQGRYSPGFHRPVHPSDVLYEKRPDLVVILAWRYAEPILKRHERYIQDGGRMLIPLPRLQEHPRTY